jgi:hypothetical protein
VLKTRPNQAGGRHNYYLLRIYLLIGARRKQSIQDDPLAFPENWRWAFLDVIRYTYMGMIILSLSLIHSRIYPVPSFGSQPAPLGQQVVPLLKKNLVLSGFGIKNRVLSGFVLFHLVSSCFVWIGSLSDLG